MSSNSDFYLRYYVGHKGKFGHEFLEFEFRPDGKLRYANNSNYKNDTMIRKEAYVHKGKLILILLDPQGNSHINDGEVGILDLLRILGVGIPLPHSTFRISI